MRISVQEAQEQLDELLDHLPDAGDILLTKEGKVVARIVPVKHATTQEERRAVLNRVRAMAPPRKSGEPTADRSHDDLYDEDGLPA